jgi:hypothetical protein
MSGHKPFGVDHDDIQCGSGGGWLAWLLMISSQVSPLLASLE